MVASLATEPEPSWMFGVEHNGSRQDVQLAIDRAVAGDVLDGRILNVMKLDDSSVSATLRTGIPVIQATRVLL
jgi:hypothetical protein